MPGSISKTILSKEQISDLEAVLDGLPNKIFGYRVLEKLLQEYAAYSWKPSRQRITVDNLIKYLTRKSRLKRVSFFTPRSQTIYIWREIDDYQIMPTLRSGGYYSHLSAMFFHRLIEPEPTNIYFNNEQPTRATSGMLEQIYIDNAFRNKQRLTTAKTKYKNKVFWLISGKQTGNYGVILMKIGNNVFPVTGLERTLIDITVRPAYSGGVSNILKAFNLAHQKVSIDELVKTLGVLNYTYPYHQSIGFYMDLAGGYRKLEIQKLMEFKPIEYDFYLDYKMTKPVYSKKWRVYYPSNLM